MTSGGVEPREDVVLAAKAALEGVTAAPWDVNRDGWATISSGSDSVFHGYFDGFCNDCGEQLVDKASVAISIEDAEFIAAARCLVPELVAEVERLRNLVAALDLGQGNARVLLGAAADQYDRLLQDGDR